MRWDFRVGMLSGLLVLNQPYAHGEVLKNPSNKMMTVVTCNVAGLDANTFMAARTATSRVFAKAEIKLDWLEACSVLPAMPSYFVVVLANDPPPGWVDAHAMGIAPTRIGDYRRAYVFLSRVKAFLEVFATDDTFQSTIGTAVGLAMAHELGHLLLPGEAHTKMGIMNPCWNRNQWQDALRGNLSFLPTQVNTMQRELDSISATRMAGVGSLQ